MSLALVLALALAISSSLSVSPTPKGCRAPVCSMHTHRGWPIAAAQRGIGRLQGKGARKRPATTTPPLSRSAAATATCMRVFAPLCGRHRHRRRRRRQLAVKLH
uniref:Putative secreted protein n=1 Tax=Anopheles darlingi TaxID=43151 RepID=A0A2M4DA20_ANODA